MQAPVTIRHIEIPCPDGALLPGLLIEPETDTTEPRPGLLFISEPFGLNEEMQRVASTFAAAGYAVCMPDLMARGSWFACVRALMADLRRGSGRAVDDLLAARRWLAGQHGVDPSRQAVLGLCMGGGFALILAKSGLFQVSAPFYGQTPESLEGACPIVASFGERDRMMRPHARRLEAELERLAIAHDVRTYPGAGHSFMTRPPNLALALLGPVLPVRAGYEPEAAKDATQRVLAFLAQHLELGGGSQA